MIGRCRGAPYESTLPVLNDTGDAYEGNSQHVGGDVGAVGLHQQQQSRAAGEDHGGGASELRNDSGLPRRIPAALPLISVLEAAAKPAHLRPQLAGKHHSGTADG